MQVRIDDIQWKIQSCIVHAPQSRWWHVLLVAPSGAFWLPPASNPASTTNVIDATFVDDEAIVLVARTSRLLDLAIQKLLEIVVRVFSLLSLKNNWLPGKTEALLKYRGRRACKHYEALRVDNKLLIQVPGVGGQFLSIVQAYKHLGNHIDVTGSVVPDARHKVDVALTAYAPLAVKLFSARDVSYWLKFLFVTSLIHSRLFFNALTVTATPAYIKILNKAYMRVLRRCTGHMLFDDNEISDVAVRVQASAPSVDCILRRKRMLYLGRIVRRSPTTLIALLHVRHKDQRLPWVLLVIKDMIAMSRTVLSDYQLKHPDIGADRWRDLLTNETKWAEYVGQVFWTESVVDAKIPAEVSIEVQALTCSICGATERKQFSNQKALLAHVRAKHGIRTEVRRYVKDGICPICRTDFKSRIRCIAHLSDTRRPKCMDRVLGGECAALPEVFVRELDSHDRIARRKAVKDGHSHPIAVGHATTGQGKTIGHVQP